MLLFFCDFNTSALALIALSLTLTLGQKKLEIEYDSNFAVFHWAWSTDCNTSEIFDPRHQNVDQISGQNLKK
jgi:hypothetical protein